MAKLKHRIETGFARFGRMVYRNRLKALLLALVLAAGIISQLPRLTSNNSTESFFHPDDPNLIAYNEFRDQFGRDEVVMAAVRPPEVFDSAFLEKLKAFHEALERDVPYLKEVNSLINIRNTYGRGDELVVEDLVREIPRTPQAMAALKQRVMTSRLYPNFYISEDGRTTVVILETLAYSPKKAGDDLMAGFSDEPVEEAPGGKDGAREAFVPLSEAENKELVLAARKVVERFNGADFPVQLTGAPVVNVYFNNAIGKDVGTFMSLAFVTFTVFLLVLFRRFSAAFLPLLVVMVSLLSTIGLMAMLGTPFSSVTSIIPSFMMSVGVSSSVHMLAVFYRRFQTTGNKEEAMVHAFGHSGLPVVMTGLTTAAGLFSFSTAKMAPVANLGLYGGIGVMLILLFSLVMMPALVALLPLKAKPRFGGARPGHRTDAVLRAIAGFSSRHAWPIVIGSLTLIAVAGSGLMYQGFGHHFIKWLPEGTPEREAIQTVDRELKGLFTVEVVVDTGQENGLYDPGLMLGIQALNDFAEGYRDENGNPVVGKTSSILEVLKETHQALNGNNPAFYAAPDSRKLIAQELLLFENSGSDDLERLVDTAFSKARLTFRVRDKDASKYVAFVNQLEAEAKRQLGPYGKVGVTGTLKLWTQTTLLLMESMAVSYGIAFVVITVLMIVLLGSLRVGLLSMVPNLAPIVITLGVMGWLGILLDMSNMLIGTVAIGLAVDDTIHFFHNFRSYYTLRNNAAEATVETMLTTGRAMLFTSLVLVTGFSFFVFSSLVNLIHFGVLIASTLVLALLADILLAPALMELISRTRRGRATLERWGSEPAFAGPAVSAELQPAESPAN